MNIQDLLSAAWRATDHGDFKTTAWFVNDLLARDNLTYDQLFNIGQCTQKAGLHEFAVEAFSRTLHISPEAVGAQFEIAKALMCQNKFEEADHYVQSVESQHHAMGKILHGHRLFQQKYYVQALQTIHPFLHYFNCGDFSDILALNCLEKIKTLKNSIKIRKIPRNIIQYWDKNIPKDVEDATKIYSSISDFNYILFDKIKAVDFVTNHYGANMADVFLRCRHPAMESDFFRVLYLNIYGGYYFDTDELLIDGKTDFLSYCENAQKEVLLWKVQSGLLANGIMSTVRNHPLIQMIIFQICENINMKKRGGIWSLTGPGALTRATVNYLFRSYFHDGTDDAILIVPDEIIRKYTWHIGFDYENDQRSWQKFEQENPQ